mgnify:FL=1
MAYRVTKTHQGITASADYPSPNPANLAEFYLVFDAKPLGAVISEINDLNLPDWSTYSADISAVLTADPVSQSFDATTQTLTIVKDWPSKALHDTWLSYGDQFNWIEIIPLIQATGFTAEEV